MALRPSTSIIIENFLCPKGKTPIIKKTSSGFKKTSKFVLLVSFFSIIQTIYSNGLHFIII